MVRRCWTACRCLAVRRAASVRFKAQSSCPNVGARGDGGLDLGLPDARRLLLGRRTTPQMLLCRRFAHDAIASFPGCRDAVTGAGGRGQDAQLPAHQAAKSAAMHDPPQAGRLASRQPGSASG